MTRLIVEEGGKRRGFKVGEGKLSIGSGSAATLKLTSAGVAEVHAELEVKDGRAVLRPMPGVLPPKVGGVPAKSETAIRHGVAIQVGEAVLRVEYDDAPQPKRARAGGPKAAPATGGAPRTAARRKPKAEWQRSRRELSGGGGLKPWVVILIFAVLAIPGGILARNAFLKTAESPLNYTVYVNKAKKDLEARMFDRAEEELDRIPADAELSPNMVATIEGLREEIASAREESKLDEYHRLGTQVLEKQLRSFETKYLTGKAERPMVRLFLKRLAAFEERFPEHPEVGWVRRMQARYGAITSLDEPPTFEDVEFEVQVLTEWSVRRDYEEAFEILEDYIDIASGDDRQKAVDMVNAKLAERQEWFVDRLQQARYEYERGQIGKSVDWLVKVIVNVGDEDMADEAAEQLILFDGIVEWFRGYERSRPDDFAELSENRVVAEFLRENPLEEPVE